VTLFCQVRSTRYFKGMLGTTYPLIQHNIPKDQNPLSIQSTDNRNRIHFSDTVIFVQNSMAMKTHQHEYPYTLSQISLIQQQLGKKTNEADSLLSTCMLSTLHHWQTNPTTTKPIKLHTSRCTIIHIFPCVSSNINRTKKYFK
jgi:hypothetical protein